MPDGDEMKKIGLLLFLLCGTAFGANWKPLIDTDKYKLFVDETSYAQAGKYRKAWFQQWYSTAQTGSAFSSYRQYTWTRQLDYVSCDERTSGALQVLYYNGDLSAGDYLGTYANKPSQLALNEVAPDTVGELMLNTICSHFKNHK